MKSTIIVVALVGLFGCGGGPKEISCDWFEGDNCWKKSVAAAVACIPTGETGVLSADRTSCSYSDNTLVTFANAVPETAPGSYAWDLSITKGGATCASFLDLTSNGGGDFRLETSLGVFRKDGDNPNEGSNVVFTCPDGEYQIDFLDALDCVDSFPGFGASATPTSASLSFLGAGSGTSANLVNCVAP